MVTTGIDRICVSVRDMQESLFFFRDRAGMNIISDQQLDPSAVQKLWNLLEGTTARSVYLKNSLQPTVVQLIEFRPGTDKSIRGDADTWDFGIYDICFVVKDLETTWKELVKNGFSFLSPPQFYSPDWVPFDVKEAILMGPDEMPIAHAEIIPPLEPVMKEEYGMMFDSAQIVPDMDEAIHFYRDILGLDKGDDNDWTGLADELLKLPQGTGMRMVLFNKEGSGAPAVECITFSMPGKKLSHAARPPNLGIFSISFETDDLSEMINTFNKEGVVLLSEPVHMKLDPWGIINTVIVEGPGNVMVELFEKQTS